MGLIAIFSSTYNHPTAAGNFNRQAFWVGTSLWVMFFIFMLPARTFRLLAIPTYIFSILLLLSVLAIGKTVYGARSWLDFGFIGFQPSEFAKIGTILALAYWLTDKRCDINNYRHLFIAISIGAIPMILILLEPDLGTAIVFAVITLLMIFWSGISLFGLFIVITPPITIFASLFGTTSLLAVLIIIIIILFYFKRNLFTNATVLGVNIAAGFIFDILFKFLKPHQQNRILSFIDPSADPLGSGYNALQAKVAIGSGGFFGKGFLGGNQTQLRFIPEQWTDFIYCVIGEEFGFLGSSLVLLLFSIFLLRIMNLSSIAGNEYGNITVIGILTLFFVHFSINIGMNLGVTPVIGIPLPFLSYGGSSLLVNMILVGMILNIYRNRRHHV